MGVSERLAETETAGVGMVSLGMARGGEDRETSPDPIGLGGEDRIFWGFAWNFARQPALQKKYCFPLCSVLKRAVAGFTAIPQTGSFACSCGLAEDDAESRGSIVLAARSRLAESSPY